MPSANRSKHEYVLQVEVSSQPYIKTHTYSKSLNIDQNLNKTTNKKQMMVGRTKKDPAGNISYIIRLNIL